MHFWVNSAYSVSQQGSHSQSFDSAIAPRSSFKSWGISCYYSEVPRSTSFGSTGPWSSKLDSRDQLYPISKEFNWLRGRILFFGIASWSSFLISFWEIMCFNTSRFCINPVPKKSILSCHFSSVLCTRDDNPPSTRSAIFSLTYPQLCPRVKCQHPRVIHRVLGHPWVHRQHSNYCKYMKKEIIF